MLDLDAPYDRLKALPQALWLPAIVTAAGDSTRRLGELAQWLQALDAGALPDEALHFGDPSALQAMRAVVGALNLPSLCEGTPALAQQVLRTMLWHLDRIHHHLPGLGRKDGPDPRA